MTPDGTRRHGKAREDMERHGKAQDGTETHQQARTRVHGARRHAMFPTFDPV